MTQLRLRFVIFGLIGLAALDILALFSIQTVRQRWYRFFYFSHVLGFVMFPIAVGLSRLHSTARPR